MRSGHGGERTHGAAQAEQGTCGGGEHIGGRGGEAETKLKTKGEANLERRGEVRAKTAGEEQRGERAEGYDKGKAEREVWPHSARRASEIEGAARI